MNRTFRRMLCILAAVVTGCTLVVNGRAMDGRVIDKETGKPIPGALVIVEWSGAVGGPVQSSRVCFHLEVVSTDADGRYHVPAWSRSPASDAEGGFFGIRNVEVTRRTYKAGYAPVDLDPNDPNIMRMSWVGPPTIDRLNALSLIGTAGCGATDGTLSREARIWRDVCEEVRSFPVSQLRQKTFGDHSFIELIDAQLAGIARQLEAENHGSSGFLQRCR
jgi:hypothetical protein